MGTSLEACASPDGTVGWVMGSWCFYKNHSISLGHRVFLRGERIVNIQGYTGLSEDDLAPVGRGSSDNHTSIFRFELPLRVGYPAAFW